jgi:hypothetical protein
MIINIFVFVFIFIFLVLVVIGVFGNQRDGGWMGSLAAAIVFAVVIVSRVIVPTYWIVWGEAQPAAVFAISTKVRV